MNGNGTRLEAIPLTRDAARAFIAKHHRHHRPPVGHLFAIGAQAGAELVGVAVVGRPVARLLNDGRTAEVTRLCTDGYRNACSFLYSACWRAAREMGFRRMVTYILQSEPGTSLRACGWEPIAVVDGHKVGKGGRWSREERPRLDLHPTEPKTRWEVRNRVSAHDSPREEQSSANSPDQLPPADCQACLGRGSFEAESQSIPGVMGRSRCRACNGTGKYPHPEPASHQ